MSDPNAQVRRRQLLLIGGSAGVILLLTLGGMLLFERSPAQRPEKPRLVSITAPGTVEDRDAWRAQESARAQDNASQISELKAELMRQQEQQKKLQEALDKAARAPESTSRADAALLSAPLTGARVPLGRPLASSGMRSDGPLAAALNTPLQPALPPVPRRELEIIQFGGSGSGATGSGRTEVLGFPVNEAAKKLGQSASASRSSRNSIEFIPAGSFVRVAMLNGIDAPTGGQAQSNPLPVALHVLDAANMANKYQLDIRDCRFIAAAWGDLSSERGLARTDSLSCIIEGETVEMQVKGQVIGEDGKAGLRGRLVTKQGQLLANALLAGIASGIGKAFQQSASTQNVSPLGSTSTVDPDNVGRAALGSGIGNAGSALEQYYLRAADKLFPVIEIDGGRIVEVLVTKGAVYNGRANALEKNYRGLVRRRDALARSNDDGD